jgi:hypothetical protein
MVIIHGESRSGKSSKVLNLIDKSKKTLYFALDFDKAIRGVEIYNKNIQVIAFPNRETYLSDLESEILNHGGLLKNDLSYVVIDPINFLKDDKKNLLEFLLKLEKIEKAYNKFQIIATINTLHHFEISNNVLKYKNIDFIKSEKRKIIKV